MVLGLVLFRPGGALAQNQQGVAVITSPLDGALLGGLVPITGSATHPQFQHYDLAFAYSPNPTNTWFTLQPPATTQVVNEIIGRWDTTQIADGLYSLRLRVYYSDTAYLEAVVQNVQVMNSTTTPSAATLDTATPAVAITLPPLASPTASATVPAIELPPTGTPAAGGPGSGSSVAPPGATRISAALIAAAFTSGVRLSVISFLLLAAYASVRAALRVRPRR